LIVEKRGARRAGAGDCAQGRAHLLAPGVIYGELETTMMRHFF